MNDLDLTQDGDRVTIIQGDDVTTIVAVTTVHDTDTDQDVKQVTTVHLTPAN